MSEANAPFNPQGQSESDELSYSPWDEPPTEATDGANTPSSTESPQLDINQIFDIRELDGAAFEEIEMLADVSERFVQSQAMPSTSTQSASAQSASAQSTSAQPTSAQSVPANLSSIAAWSQDVINQMEPANLSDLVTLIQELNQCNGVLMDRVSQLEEALEYSQNALQAEVGRTQEVQSVYNAQDWATVQEQVTTLFNQLEFAHQANQRQQILIETLTGQMENSQERVAQLEREAALIQQHYNEQTQQLSKSESACRDLQARLQRQQRYTLQFKAALEKCLEVPTPQYETGAVAPEPAVDLLADAPFLPKAQRIQPWSAHTQPAGKSPWMNLHQLDLPAEDAAPEPETNPTQAPPASPQPTHLNLPSFGLPLLQVAADEEGAISEAEAAIDRDLREQVHRLTNDPALKQQLDAAVKPLADMLAEALLADQTAPTETPEAPPLPTSEPTANELLASVMADAEDALWQDLARLIDVSTEEVVKASLSGDLAAFESLDFASLPANQVPANPAPVNPVPVNPVPVNPVPVNQAPVNQAPEPFVVSTEAELQDIQDIAELERAESLLPTPAPKSPNEATVPPLLRRASQASAETPSTPPAAEAQGSPQEPVPALATSSWPSPVVYPLRPTKKRQSLAMVDLPSFPRS